MPTLPVQGTLIDGSEDPVLAEPEIVSLKDAERAAETSMEALTEDPFVVGEDQPLDLVEPLEVAEVVVLEEGQPDEPEAKEEVDDEPEGPIELTYQDLSLIDYDVDAILDYMLFPEDYEGEDKDYLEFPEDIKRLDGREVSIVGYMIPGEIDRGNVRDFMLVRDLMGCCFGGAPMPDEWVDVIMEEDAEAEYRAYMPMRVTGVMTLGGDQDEAGFALGIYRMKATEAQLED